MILLVPESPEVPNYHLPRLWQGLVLVLILSIAYSYVEPVVTRDRAYVDGVQKLVDNGTIQLGTEKESYLKLRPLLEIAPAHADWDVKRLLLANFIHGNRVHLFLNLIAAYAGARICTTFLSFFWIMFIFIVGGTLGLTGSVLLPGEYSPYIPHVGASAGIFALMGTYYIYNFKFRTRYFFWFPSRHGKLALPTSWFFFFDVILLELVFSMGQLYPTRLDSIDHISHVIGFTFGVSFALFLRLIQRWPNFIHTRGELMFWHNLKQPPIPASVHTPLETWLRCLEINPYNDYIKKFLFSLILQYQENIRDEQIERAFRFVRPAFCRRDAPYVAGVIKGLLKAQRRIPPLWLRNTPYDVIIRVARHMVTDPEEQILLYQFISAYQTALPQDAGFHHKLELLLTKIGGLIPQRSPGFGGPGGIPGNASAGNTPPQGTPHSPPGKAGKGY
ncbi:MAG: rhomboid family intramembrane serine protease [Bdellovibrionaceae bacterium]|nr:rhomboid family intramembrane serine protease [Bdellovibrionales bacterium]MCB9253449.1 rhomboid family intramembrane serine protease [Pseudobdellovibrionaceae bacterium]